MSTDEPADVRPEVSDGVPAPRAPEVVVITGMSGAGRTQVAKVLEDHEYYVVDNLPPPLVPRVVDLAFEAGSKVQRLALVADVRAGQFFDDLVGAIRDLQRQEVSVRVVYLEADDDTLVSRFEATRRRHPAAEPGDGVLAGIRRERARLEELRGLADLVLDTTMTNVHELRDRVVAALGDPDGAELRVKVVSFGFKYGVPRDAEVVMDVRFLPNPHWIEELRPLTGQDDPVRRFVLDHPATDKFMVRFLDLLDVLVPGYEDEGKRYLSMAIGCTGGKHRSVAIAEEVAGHLRATTSLPVGVEHRDLGHE